ncbi:MAG: endopeptidase La [Candidatus Woesebacteria bacterium]|jgi:ATP-dependent Lon protease
MSDNNQKNNSKKPKKKLSSILKQIKEKKVKAELTGDESKEKINLPVSQLNLPVIPIREGVLFPNTESILTFGRKLSLAAIKESAKRQKLVVLLTQKKPSTKDPKKKDLYQVGSIAIIERTLKTENSVSALIRGIGRIQVNNFTSLRPVMTANVSKLYDQLIKDDETQALVTHLQKLFKKIVQMGKPVEFLNFMRLMSGVNEGELADQIASTLNIKTKEKQKLLETTNVKERIKKIISYLTQEMKVLEIEKDVVHKTQAKFDKHMRENILRERLKTIQKELGEIEDDEAISEDYDKKLKKAKFSEEIKSKVNKEIKRLKQMSVNNPERGYVKTWLDVVFDLPWGKSSKTNIDLEKAEKTLEKNHYGLSKVKDRILEYMAVLQLKQKQSKSQKITSPTILCFVGPPGVGKTSIGKSIAEALKRKFTKISLGGIRDEAEIRGHRKTYVGAMTGRIIKGIMQAKTMNPVFMLDEVDKIGKDFRGDPSAALLEVLDPEQNQNFEDHYLDIPFDLSQVMFITTANTLSTIPPALRDRLEIIRYPGYTFEEKFNIAKKYLLKKVLADNGLKANQLKISDQMINYIAQRYTREAGVRELERNLSKIARKTAKKIIESERERKGKRSLTIDKNTITEFLGPEKFDITLAEEKNKVGLATGLAWTQVGGDVLFVEVALTPGKGNIKLTGKLGEVMKESAQAALTYVKSNAKKLGIASKSITSHDIHVHVPEGAIPKDGPSAGITITTAMVSAFSKKTVRKNVAMTGEITLRGRVLRIGGLKEKVIAAHRAGIKTVIIPKSNERDIVDIPDSAKKDITFKAVEEMNEVLEIALSK